MYEFVRRDTEEVTEAVLDDFWREMPPRAELATRSVAGFEATIRFRFTTPSAV